jgi:GxxExxY protein
MEDLNKITYQIIGCAYKVHRSLGPGLLESTYEACLIQEIFNIGLSVKQQVGLPLIYNGKKLEVGYRIDLLVEDKIIIEIKSVEAIIPIHKAQVLTYLKLSNQRIGLLINFNVINLQDGISRLINGYQ